jgi:hypothetical protein
MLDVVTVAVIEGQNRKRPRRRTWTQPIGNLIERDDIEPLVPQRPQDNIEKRRGDFENPVRRERARAPRPDMVKHQDHTPAPREEAKPAIGASCG